MIMNEQVFWNLIDQARNEADGDLEEQYNIAVSKLSQYPAGEILEFGRIFSKYLAESYTSELWAAAYIINGGCSDDGFDYFRGWLISKGRKVYENAIKDPESLTDVLSDEDSGEVEFEEFLYVANEAYTLCTGKDDFYDKAESIPYPEIEIMWDEDEEELMAMYPRLAERFL